MEAKVYRIASELNQTNTQTIVDDLQDAYLTICGMPNRNGGSFYQRHRAGGHLPGWLVCS